MFLGRLIFFISCLGSIGCILNIVLNFLYFKLDTNFFSGNLYFWHCQFLLFFLSLIIICSKLQYKRHRFFYILFLYCSFIFYIPLFFSSLLLNFRSFFLFFVLLIFLTSLYFIIFYFTTRIRLMLLFLLNAFTFMLCQNIFKVKDIPETFKTEHIPTPVKKFFIKKIY